MRYHFPHPRRTFDKFAVGRDKLGSCCVCRPADERGVVRVYVGSLDLYKTLGVFGGGSQSFSEQLGDRFYQLGVQTGEAL